MIAIIDIIFQIIGKINIKVLKIAFEYLEVKMA